MSRLAFMLAILVGPACAATNSSVRSSSAEGPPSVKQGEVPPDSSTEEAVPEWLKKKPPGDPSAAEFRERMAEERRQFLQLFDDKAATIDFTDGIDASEGEFIGGAYFSMTLGACGSPGKATDGGTEWLMRPRVGVTGHPLPDLIRVDKLTGAIRLGSGPTTEAKAAIEFQREILRKSVERFSKRSSAPEPANPPLQ